MRLKQKPAIKRAWERDVLVHPQEKQKESRKQNSPPYFFSNALVEIKSGAFLFSAGQ